MIYTPVYQSDDPTFLDRVAPSILRWQWTYCACDILLVPAQKMILGIQFYPDFPDD